MPVRERTRERHRVLSEQRIERLVRDLGREAWHLVMLTFDKRDVDRLRHDIDAGRVVLGATLDFSSPHFDQFTQVIVSEPGVSWGDKIERILAIPNKPST